MPVPKALAVPVVPTKQRTLSFSWLKVHCDPGASCGTRSSDTRTATTGQVVTRGNDRNITFAQVGGRSHDPRTGSEAASNCCTVSSTRRSYGGGSSGGWCGPLASSTHTTVGDDAASEGSAAWWPPGEPVVVGTDAPGASSSTTGAPPSPPLTAGALGASSLRKVTPAYESSSWPLALDTDAESPPIVSSSCRALPLDEGEDSAPRCDW